MPKNCCCNNTLFTYLSVVEYTPKVLPKTTEDIMDQLSWPSLLHVDGQSVIMCHVSIHMYTSILILHSTATYYSVIVLGYQGLVNE